MLDKNIKALRVKAVISTGEPLLYKDKELIKKVFFAKVYNDYGSREFHHIGFSCPEGCLHILEDINYVEFIPIYKNICKIIVTSLYNYTMPFIRYDLGDYIILNNNDSLNCNMGFRAIEDNIYRGYNYLFLRDGKLVSPATIIGIIQGIKGVEDFQLLQVHDNRLILNVVYKSGAKDEAYARLKKLADNLERKFGFKEIIIQEVNHIPFAISRKFEHIKSKVVV